MGRLPPMCPSQRGVGTPPPPSNEGVAATTLGVKLQQLLFFLIFFASLELFLLYFENTSLFVFFRNTFQFTRQIFFYGLQGQPLHRKHFTIFTFSKNSFHNLTFLSGNVKFIVRGDMNQTTFGLDV